MPDTSKPALAPETIELNPTAVLGETMAFAQVKENHLWMRVRVLSSDNAALTARVATLEAELATAKGETQ